MRDLLSVLEQRMLEPTARGLVTAVTAAIREGLLPPGTRLPPIRTIATQLGLSPTTVSAAWSLLARSGTIRTEGRRGTTVTDVGAIGTGRYRRALQRTSEFRLDLSTGVPDSRLLPDLRPALRSLTTAGTPSSYLDDPVLPELVDVLANDWPYPAAAFTITDGAMDAIELIARTTMRFGDRVAVEHPGFPPLLDLLDALGVETVGIPVDESGLDLPALTAALDSPVAAVVLQPRAQNPTGVSMTEHRAREVAQVLSGSDAVVVEDDSAGAIAHDPAISIGRWLPDRTLHIRSFSKSHGPDLRLAAVSGPSALIAELTARRQLGQGWSSRLLQRILLHLLTDPRTVDVLDHARREYARRRSAAVQRLEEHGIRVAGTDGLNLWVPVHDENAAVVRLASQGVGVAPGAPFAVLPDQQRHVRVTVGLLGTEEQSVIDQLAAACRPGISSIIR
jgi:DNA-binding transcriptional MocR family regulator